MAKIAGRKNNGAWYRTNKLIKEASDELQTALANALNDLPVVIAAYNIIQQQATTLGLTEQFNYPTVEDWVAELCTDGIPLDVWLGNCSYDVYVRTGNPGSYKYTPTISPILRKASIQIRLKCKHILLTARQLGWLAQLNTPAPVAAAAAAAVETKPKKSLTIRNNESKLPVRPARTRR